jgi:hypothetical protein
MFRGSSPGNTYFKSNNILQMAVGNNVTPVYSSLTEQYTTPGISMMSVLDIWHVDFTAAPSSLPFTYWLDSANNVAYTSLPTTATNNTSTNYDRIVVINTEGRNTATVWIETAPLSNVFWQAGSIFTDSSYTLIIPAGRRWRVSMNIIGGETVTDGALDVSPAAVANDRSAGTYVRFMSYKFGMN